MQVTDLKGRPDSQSHCLRCGTPMKEVGEAKFRGVLPEDASSILRLEHLMAFMIEACPNCGKVELFL